MATLARLIVPPIADAEPAINVPSPVTRLADDVSPQITQELKAIGVARVIVVLRSPADASVSAAAHTNRSAATSLDSYFSASDLSQASALLRSTNRGAAARTAAAAMRASQSGVPPVERFENLGVMLGTVTQDGLENLMKDSRVATVTGAPQFSLIRPQRVEPAKLSSPTTWGLDLLRVPVLWKQGLSGKGVRVGHLDTGADGRHPALKAAIAQFAEVDFVGRLKNPNPAPYDSDEHGTHTAGTIAGRAVQGKYIGVAPGADLCCAMVIEGGEIIARILGGLNWAVGQGVKVISLSLGLRGWWEDLIPIVHILRARNVLPVIAVGNEGPGTSRSPGNYPEALSVGAVDQAGQVADFSSSQRFARNDDPIVPDVVAPGVNVISARPANRYQSMDGSSMATPHIAGLAALLCEAKPNSTVSEVEEAIFSSCNLGRISPDRGNHGIPDAVAALQKLTGINALPTTASRKNTAVKRKGKSDAGKKRTKTKRR